MTLDRSGWSRLTVEAISRLDSGTFEDLCHQIVNVESCDRHAPNHEIDGPSGDYSADGGRDILLTVKSPPSTSKADYQRERSLKPVTEDAIGRTAYSCKTGGDWLNKALVDATSRGKRAVEVLGEGGHFKVFINEIGKLDQPRKRGDETVTAKAHLVRELSARLLSLSLPVTGIEERIEILDAHAIRNFLVYRNPGALLEVFASALELTKELATYDEWSSQHDGDRKLTPFHPDPDREAKAVELRDHLKSAGAGEPGRVSLVVGPSGIGKTAFLLWALRDDDVRNRLRVSFSFAAARDALDDGFLDRHSDAILVVDDCSEEDAKQLAALFVAKARRFPDAQLLVLVPTKILHGDRRSKVWIVEPLAAASTAALVTTVSRGKLNEAAVRIVVRLAEGFPYFAVRLGEEAALEERAPDSLDEAVNWVLASRHEAATETEREDLRWRRCRALAAIALSRGIALDRLPPAEQERVARAVGLTDWATFHQERRRCGVRGLVRAGLGDHFAYVTPLILEREVLKRLFGPGGPDEGARKLQQEASEFHKQLFERLDALQLSPEVRLALATAASEDLRAAERLSELGERQLTGARLMFLARERPAPTAVQLRRLVEAETLDDLRRDESHRRDLVWSLDEIVARTQGFLDAESALFRLAQAENETYGNNASAVWSGIYSVELSTVHWPLSQRVLRLKARLGDAAVETRLMALAGVEAMLETRTFRFVGGSPDLEPVPPTNEEIVATKRAAWCLLVEASTDGVPSVAARAKSIAIEQLRGAVRMGMAADAIDAVTRLLRALSPEERLSLRAKIDEIKAYDDTFLGASTSALDDLEARIQPTAFSERLRDSVGRWPPAAERAGMDEADEALAREGLTGDRPLLAELDWLFSEGAMRARAFLWAIGRQDAAAHLLREMLARAVDMRAMHLATGYLGGLAQVVDQGVIDAVLRELRSDPTRASLAVLATVNVGLTSERIEALLPIVAGRTVEPGSLLELGRRYDASAVEPQVALRLARTLLDLRSEAGVSASLELLKDLLEQRPDQFAAAREIVEEAVAVAGTLDVAGMGAYYWERVARILIDHDGVKVAAGAAFAMLGQGPGRSTHEAWAVVHRAFQQDSEAAWSALACALESSDRSTGRVLLNFRFKRGALPLPTDRALAWVGDDERRGRMVASIVDPYAAVFPPILRELVRRFGVQSSVAREIAARMHSTRGVVSSISEDDKARMQLARGWMTDSDPLVADFASQLARQLERSAEYNAAIEEEERTRYGT